MKEDQKHLTSHIEIDSVVFFDVSSCNETIYIYLGPVSGISSHLYKHKKREKQELFHSDQDNISFPFQDENTAKKCYATIMETN